MNPISRLRMRARSACGRLATSRPLSKYSPRVGESSRPRIESSVDLPQPEGPAMDTYCPRSIVSEMFDSACVSTSSVTKTLVMPFSEMSDDMRLPAPFLCGDLFEADALDAVPGGHVGEDHAIALREAFQHFDRVDRRAP